MLAPHITVSYERRVAEKGECMQQRPVADESDESDEWRVASDGSMEEAGTDDHERMTGVAKGCVGQYLGAFTSQVRRKVEIGKGLTS